MASHEARIASEAALLSAIAVDDADAVEAALNSSGGPSVLLTLQVKRTHNNAADSTAFFHSVASYGLSFAVGDTAVQLARRNRKTHACDLLSHASEAALLSAIAADNADGVEAALKNSGKPEALLALQVKQTLRNASDATAFFHSVASFGLSFALGETALQLAKRNGKTRAFEALCRASGLEQRLSTDEARVAAEARLLQGLAADDAEAVRLCLEDSPGLAKVLLNLKVKESYGVMSDHGAFFHSVASFGLSFQLGDTAQGLARRNGLSKAARALGAQDEKALLPVWAHVTLRQVSGKVLAEFDVDTCVRASELVSRLNRQVPLPKGPVHRTLLLGERHLEPGAALAGYSGLGESIALTVVTVHGGAFRASINQRARPKGKDGPRCQIGLKLLRGGRAEFDFTQWPIDNGHCAPPSGGLKLAASGSWSVVSQGVHVKLTQGTEASMQRGHWGLPSQCDSVEEMLFGRTDDGGLVLLDGPPCRHRFFTVLRAGTTLLPCAMGEEEES